MSHYTALATAIRDEDCLVRALAAVGYPKVERHAAGAPLVGYQGDYRRADDPNAHTTDAALAVKAHVIVRRREISVAANDLGFERTADGTYRAIISGYDSQRHDKAWVGKLTQAYNRELHLQKAKALGYRVKEEKLASGAIKLSLSR